MKFVNKCEKENIIIHISNSCISMFKSTFHFLTSPTKTKKLNLKIEGSF